MIFHLASASVANVRARFTRLWIGCQAYASLQAQLNVFIFAGEQNYLLSILEWNISLSCILLTETTHQLIFYIVRKTYIEANSAYL